MFDRYGFPAVCELRFIPTTDGFVYIGYHETVNGWQAKAVQQIVHN